MSTKYIREFNGNIPIILQSNKLLSFKKPHWNNEYFSLNCKEDQFTFSKILNKERFYYHGSNSRLTRYYFGKGMLFRQRLTVISAIFCENNKVVVENNWIENWTTDFARFKKMLKENGYNIKTDIVYMDSLEDFFFDPLAPTFQDYQEDFQREISGEFILSQRPAIISSEEKNIVQEEFNPLLTAC